jgi:predicted amino acid dehydrogenase
MKTLKLLWHIFRDLLIRFLPKRLTKLIIKQAEFAFLVHPRNLKDMSRKYAFIELLPDSLAKFCVKHLWPIVVSSITGLKDKEGREIHGYVIGCPMLAEQMMKNRKLAVKRIIQSIKLAEKLGIKNIGLGALTSSLTRGGIDVKDRVEIEITPGYAYTVVTVVDYVFRVAEKLDIALDESCVAIVGAAGSVGSNSARILANDVNNFLLIDVLHKKDRIKELIKDLKGINPKVLLKYSDDIHSIYSADIIIAATNAPETIIHSKDLKPGAVVVDDAQPSDVDMDIIKNRNDVLVVEGGAIKIPGISTHFDFGLFGKENNFSCLGEVLILTYFGESANYSFGKIDSKIINKIKDLGKKINFSSGDFQNSYKLYSLEDIERVKGARKKI